mgnify:CR=1 FL=1
MAHTHSHPHSRVDMTMNWVYYLAIGLNLGYVVLEVVMGLVSNSVGLLSDAGHKLIDVFSLVIALVAFKLSGSKASRKFNFGYRKTSILISLFNALLLFAAVLVIIYESIEKFASPSQVDADIISWTAGVGILVSGASALLLNRQHSKDINTRGAFLHMATDSLISLGVVLSGVIIRFTGWVMLDPIVSILISCVILFNTLKLLRESFRMSIDAFPSDLDYDALLSKIEACPGVRRVAELKVWPVSVTQNALTSKVEVDNPADGVGIVKEIRKSLEEFNIDDLTIEIQ